ncbi:MAG: hypothetical protein ACREQF_01410 [Candidatus Binataceae bacterium]
MAPGATVIEHIESHTALEEFARFPFQVYGGRDAWWPPDVQNEIDMLSGSGPFTSFLEIEPICARRDGHMVARVCAVINRRHNEHWNEALGLLTHFEALEGEDAAVAAMLADAIESLRDRRMRAVRSGFAAFLDYPYSIDNYGQLPPFLLRANPARYHCHFKDTGFVTERGQADFTAELSPDLVARYRSIVDGAQVRDHTARTWREFGFLAAIDAWTNVTNAAFARHWGWYPIKRTEVRPMLMSLWDTPVADLSMIATAGDEVVGAVFSVPDFSQALARVRGGVRLDAEVGGGTRGALVNIGVLEPARGGGVAVAMAARSFLEMANRGMRYAGYTLVLDNNWPSRRTAAALGAHVTSNFVTYRRDFR